MKGAAASAKAEVRRSALQPRATDCQSVTWTFGRAWRRRLPRARSRSPGWPRAWWRSAAAPSAAGSARPRPEGRGVPHLDDRGAADVEAHQRAAADLVDDGVGEREQDALAGRRGGDRGRAARVGRDRAGRGRGGRGRRRWPRTGRARAGRSASARRASADGASAAAPRPAGATGAATRIRRQRRNGALAIVAAVPGDGPSAMSARRCSSASAKAAPAAVATVDLEVVVAGGEELEQRPDVLGHQRRGEHGQPARLGRLRHRAARLLGQAEDLASPAPRAAARPASARSRGRCGRTARHPVPCAARHRDRDRGLGHLELSGGRLDRSVPCDEHERLQLSEGHKRSLNSV